MINPNWVGGFGRNFASVYLLLLRHHLRVLVNQPCSKFETTEVRNSREDARETKHRPWNGQVWKSDDLALQTS